MSPPFSVVMSVYRNDQPKFVQQAIESIYSLQSLKPNEIVIVIDGPVPENLGKIIRKYEQLDSEIFKTIWLPENKGLGNALRIGVEKAKYGIIARMDSDDISAPDRFEKQLTYLKQHPECDVVGGQITEFIETEDNIIGIRRVATDAQGINMDLKHRCPFNHMTVMMKKTAVMAAGNYQTWHYNEDYFLWIRMALNGALFANLPDTLVNVRVGKEMYSRRGGWKYFKSEEGIQRYMTENQLISGGGYLTNTIIRLIVQVLLPNNLRGWVFRKFARK